MSALKVKLPSKICKALIKEGKRKNIVQLSILPKGKYWEKKLRVGEPITHTRIINKLHEILPGIIENLTHPFWQIISLNSLTRTEVNYFISDLNNKLKQDILVKDKSVLCFVRKELTDLKEIQNISKGNDLNSLAYLVLLLKERKFSKRALYLDCTFRETFFLFFRLASTEPLSIVGYELYIRFVSTLHRNYLVPFRKIYDREIKALIEGNSSTETCFPTATYHKSPHYEIFYRITSYNHYIYRYVIHHLKLRKSRRTEMRIFEKAWRYNPDVFLQQINMIERFKRSYNSSTRFAKIECVTALSADFSQYFTGFPISGIAAIRSHTNYRRS